MDDYSFPNLTSQFDMIGGIDGFINIYQAFTGSKIWPRGLLLSLFNADFYLSEHIINKEANICIWQGLANEDPDEDAIYRLTSVEMGDFENRAPVA